MKIYPKCTTWKAVKEFTYRSCFKDCLDSKSVKKTIVNDNYSFLMEVVTLCNHSARYLNQNQESYLCNLYFQTLKVFLNALPIRQTSVYDG